MTVFTILKCEKIEGRVGPVNSPTIHHDIYDNTSDESGLARASVLHNCVHTTGIKQQCRQFLTSHDERQALPSIPAHPHSAAGLSHSATASPPPREGSQSQNQSQCSR